jgi:DNA-binding MarR family transcriptional regulator
LTTTKQETLGFLLSDTSRLLRRAFQEKLVGSELSMSEAKALFYVSRQEGLRQVDLASLLEVQPIAAARLIDRLESLDLLERRPAPDDRRAYLLYLLPRAHPVLERFEADAADIRQIATKGLNRAEVSALHVSLQYMRDNLYELLKK